MNERKGNEGQEAMRRKAKSRRGMTSREDSSTDKTGAIARKEKKQPQDDDERMDMTLAEQGGDHTSHISLSRATI